MGCKQTDLAHEAPFSPNLIHANINASVMNTSFKIPLVLPVYLIIKGLFSSEASNTFVACLIKWSKPFLVSRKFNKSQEDI